MTYTIVSSEFFDEFKYKIEGIDKSFQDTLIDVTEDEINRRLIQRKKEELAINENVDPKIQELFNNIAHQYYKELKWEEDDIVGDDFIITKESNYQTVQHIPNLEQQTSNGNKKKFRTLQKALDQILRN
eukprot:TRINITY_DN1368_c0_g1_i2.p1 TRINITY_DN1368_c0_g1~~TRINITY_DN1368_c0_g1_i2.p1  ORF type:complete len:129 (+),score=36.92 TRINITY_DN1368_c0_g1_i2:137-523(+)